MCVKIPKVPLGFNEIFTFSASLQAWAAPRAGGVCVGVSLAVVVTDGLPSVANLRVLKLWEVSHCRRNLL